MTTVQPPHIRKPRCFLLYALAPNGLNPADVNRLFNQFVADPSLPLVLFHDHFIGQPGGVAIFYADSAENRHALYNHTHLTDWTLQIQPLIYAYDPAAFDAQIAYTLSAYRDTSWDDIRKIKRPPYGDLQQEVTTAQEDGYN